MDENMLSMTAGVLSVPERATPPQAAAIAAAVGAHIRDQEAALAHEADTDEEVTWDGERFAFAGRLDGLSGHGRSVPAEAPTDKWTTTGRRDRYDR
jgi:hypothetical protein